LTQVERTIEKLKNLNLAQKIADCKARIAALEEKDKQGRENRIKIRSLETSRAKEEALVAQYTSRKNALELQKSEQQKQKDLIDAQIRRKESDLATLQISNTEENEAARTVRDLEAELSVQSHKLR